MRRLYSRRFRFQRLTLQVQSSLLKGDSPPCRARHRFFREIICLLNLASDAQHWLRHHGRSSAITLSSIFCELAHLRHPGKRDWDREKDEVVTFPGAPLAQRPDHGVIQHFMAGGDGHIDRRGHPGAAELDLERPEPPQCFWIASFGYSGVGPKTKARALFVFMITFGWCESTVDVSDRLTATSGVRVGFAVRCGRGNATRRKATRRRPDLGQKVFKEETRRDMRQ